MDSMGCLGRECKLGWGYNQFLHLLIPVQGQPLNVTSEPVNQWWYGVGLLSSDVLPYWPWLSLYLEPSCKRQLDFEIVFDDTQCWEVRCHFYRRTEGSQKFSNYPPNCSHFVEQIYYGVDIDVYFPKTGFPENVKQLFEERNFNQTQKKAMCKVLINYDETREMTLEELLEFMSEFDQGKHSEYDVPVLFYYEKLPQEIRDTVISNEGYNFTRFLGYLYSAYRKIEIKMQQNEYPGILADFDSQEKSLDQISSNLKKAKEEYKSMDGNNFLKMYPILKKLFSCYTDYIRYSIDHQMDIHEGDQLPGAWEDIRPWLKQLNTWLPEKVNIEDINWISSFIAMPPDYQQVLQTLLKTQKFTNYYVLTGNQGTEPFIRDEKDKKMLFGFVDMEGAIQEQIPDDSTVLESKCPDECTQDVKRWICTKCGDFILQKDLALFCACGSKRYIARIFRCHHPNHQKSRIWITPNEIRELNSREFNILKKEIEEGKHSEIDIPIPFYLHIFTAKSLALKISNYNEFTAFISHLYFVYRQFEIKMTNNRYEHILTDSNSEEESFVKICTNLDKAKDNFKTMNKNDFLSMYPVIKRLFFSYMDYIRCSVELESNIDEGKYLPGQIDELKSWLEQLTTWFPIKINGEWKNCMGQFIGIPNGFQHVITALHKTTKLKEIPIFSDQTTEPYIGQEGNIKIIFGLADMKGAKESNMKGDKKSEILKDSKLFEWECPKRCREDQRRWICTTCGEFIRMNQMILYCSCGSKKYSDSLLICHHPSHRPENQGQKSTFVFNYNDLLPKIRRELQIIKERYGGYPDVKVHIAIDYLSGNRSEQEVRDALTNLEGLDLEATTRRMIELYLKRNY